MIKVTHIFADGSRADSLYGKRIEVTKENESIYRGIARILVDMQKSADEESAEMCETV